MIASIGGWDGSLLQSLLLSLVAILVDLGKEVAPVLQVWMSHASGHKKQDSSVTGRRLSKTKAVQGTGSRGSFRHLPFMGCRPVFAYIPGTPIHTHAHSE